jgi:enhancer of polycomb-like protein
MVRLKAELAQSHNLALAILQREQLKRNQTHNTLFLWKSRCKALELKRKVGWSITKEEEDSLVDKERLAKKPKTLEST